MTADKMNLKDGMRVLIKDVNRRESCRGGLVGTMATVYEERDKLRLRFDARVGELKCSTCGLLRYFTVEIMEEDKMTYNGKPVKEFVEDEGNKFWELENGNKVFEMPSVVGLGEIEVVNVIDEDKEEVRVILTRDDETVETVAKADEIGGKFLPMVLTKIATARMIEYIGQESVKELVGMSVGDLKHIELVMSLGAIKEMI